MILSHLHRAKANMRVEINVNEIIQRLNQIVTTQVASLKRSVFYDWSLARLLRYFTPGNYSDPVIFSDPVVSTPGNYSDPVV